MKLKATVVFDKNMSAFENPKVRIIANQGGSRSSKTYSICQLLITYALRQSGQVITIVRDALPAVKTTVQRDFFAVLNELNIFDPNAFSKVENTYTLNGCLFEFRGLDDPQKVKGATRDILWCNEANELTLEKWRQLTIRTKGKYFIDYNPSDEHHWIYEEVLTRNDCIEIRSTYKDNPFLPKEQVEEIESYREKDDEFWKVYGLGERGQLTGLIYSGWQAVEKPPGTLGGLCGYGLDFGINNPTALIYGEVHYNASVNPHTPIYDIYFDEILYQSNMTNAELIEFLKSTIVNKSLPIYCDSADKNRITEIRQAGFNALPSDKDVNQGIDILKRNNVYYTRGSANIEKEYRNYKWQKNRQTGQLMEVPVKAFDHALDACRYFTLTHLKHTVGVLADTPRSRRVGIAVQPKSRWGASSSFR